jgi:hypothetical protein
MISRQKNLDSGGPEPEGHQSFAGISAERQYCSRLISDRRAEEQGVPALSSGHCLPRILGHKIHEKRTPAFMKMKKHNYIALNLF